MFELDPHESLSAFKDALALGDVSAAQSAMINLGLALAGFESLDPDIFSEIEAIIGSDNLVRFSDPHLFLSVISDSLHECFSQDQKARLTKLFQETYERLNDSAASMLLVEMLTTLLGEDEFFTFARDMTKKGTMQRAILGYGLGYFATKSNPSPQAILVVTSLLDNLAKDADVNVRSEANHALAKIRRATASPRKKK